MSRLEGTADSIGLAVTVFSVVAMSHGMSGGPCKFIKIPMDVLARVTCAHDG